MSHFPDKINEYLLSDTTQFWLNPLIIFPMKSLDLLSSTTELGPTTYIISPILHENYGLNWSKRLPDLHPHPLYY